MAISMKAAAILCVLVCSSLVAEAVITCGTTTQNIAPCLGFLTSSLAQPPPRCCNSIKDLNNKAQSHADRKAACICLKNEAASLKTLKYSQATALPSACGVKLPFAIGQSTNCNNL